MCEIKALLFIYTILGILCLCSCFGTTPITDTDTSATVLFDIKSQKHYKMMATLLEGEPVRFVVESKKNINIALYENQELNKVETTPDNSKIKTFDIDQNDESPGLKNYTFLMHKGTMQPYNVTYKGTIYKPVYCEARIHVRLIKTPLTIAINYMDLETVRTNLTVTDHDAVAHYKFREGELADISCEKQDEFGNLTLQYRDMETTVKPPMKSKSLRLQVKLKSEDSGSYLTCSMQNERDYTIVRVYFQLEAEPDDDITIRVNGLKLRPQELNAKDTTTPQKLDFRYKLRFNELATVECEKKKFMPGFVSFQLSDTSETVENENVDNVTKQMKDEDFSLNCFYTKGPIHAPVIIAAIDFVYDNTLDFDILGLPADNIKYKYKDATRSLVQSQYEYSDGDKLNLSCTKTQNKLKLVYILYWNFTDDSNINILNNTLMSQPSSPISHSFILSSASDNRVLLCLVYQNIRDQRNQMKESPYLTIAVKLTMRTNEQPVTQPAESTTETIPGGGESFFGKVKLAAIIGGLCILILIMALMAYTICARKPQRKRDSNINYENLNQSTNNIIPNPTQWNEEHYARPIDLKEDTDTYSVPYNPKNKEELYSKPQPKSLRNKNKAQETKNYESIEPTYSEIGKFDVKDCNDPNYAEVVPKALRNNLKGDDKNNYANAMNSSNYAEVLPKSKRNNDEKKNYVLPKDETNYAEIATEALRKPSNNDYANLNKESNYAEVVHMIQNRNKYVNVIPNNEPYVNANSSDYTEPAYCELNLKNYKVSK